MSCANCQNYEKLREALEKIVIEFKQLSMPTPILLTTSHNPQLAERMADMAMTALAATSDGWIKVEDQAPPHMRALKITDGVDISIAYYTTHWGWARVIPRLSLPAGMTNDLHNKVTHWQPIHVPDPPRDDPNGEGE